MVIFIIHRGGSLLGCRPLIIHRQGLARLLNFKFLFVALHQFPHLPDVKGSHTSATANQDGFCRVHSMNFI